MNTDGTGFHTCKFICICLNNLQRKTAVRFSPAESHVQRFKCADISENDSACRLKKSNEMQQYADIYSLLNYSTCFGCPSRPSSGVHKTVVAASGTDHTVWGASLPPTQYDLQLQFYVLLMMGVMDTRNM